jgi:MFS family permease
MSTLPHTATSTPRWLVGLCLSRFALSLIFNAYAGVMPLLRDAWGMSAARAATIQSAWHLGYLVSLFVVGMLADRYGARRTYLVSSILAALAAGAFALGSHGYMSALVLYGVAGITPSAAAPWGGSWRPRRSGTPPRWA